MRNDPTEWDKFTIQSMRLECFDLKSGQEKSKSIFDYETTINYVNNNSNNNNKNTNSMDSKTIDIDLYL